MAMNLNFFKSHQALHSGSQNSPACDLVTPHSIWLPETENTTKKECIVKLFSTY